MGPFYINLFVILKNVLARIASRQYVKNSVSDYRLWYKIRSQSADIIKYLGIIIDKKMTGKVHIDSSVKRAAKRYQLLKRLTATKWGFTQDVYKIYRHLIL